VGRSHVAVRLIARIIEKATRQQMLVPRVLGWYPKAAFSSGAMEGLVCHGEGRATARLLQLVRIQVSLQTGCPFCVEMNTSDLDSHAVTQQELDAILRGDPDCDTFSRHEVAALRYTRNLTSTPPVIDPDLADELTLLFSERELVIVSTTVAQVNYWARLLQGLGIPPACPIPQSTRRGRRSASA